MIDGARELPLAQFSPACSLQPAACALPAAHEQLQISASGANRESLALQSVARVAPARGECTLPPERRSQFTSMAGWPLVSSAFRFCLGALALDLALDLALSVCGAQLLEQSSLHFAQEWNFSLSANANAFPMLLGPIFTLLSARCLAEDCLARHWRQKAQLNWRAELNLIMIMIIKLLLSSWAALRAAFQLVAALCCC